MATPKSPQLRGSSFFLGHRVHRVQQQCFLFIFVSLLLSKCELREIQSSQITLGTIACRPGKERLEKESHITYTHTRLGLT